MDMEVGGKGAMDLLLQHSCHEHTLVFAQDFSPPIPDHDEDQQQEEAVCDCCGKRVEGPSYCCSDCKFYLHKKCAELELASQINHPFHPFHPLSLLPKPPYNSGGCVCDFCGRDGFSRFVYHCDSCNFDLHVNCALLKTSSAENFPKRLHDHPMIFIENHTKEANYRCRGCKQALSGPIYKCLDCDMFYLDKKCLELDPEINHPFHPKHPLTLLPESPDVHTSTCNFCGYHVSFGFVYHCPSCQINLEVSCALLHTSSAENFPNSLHDHPMILIENHTKEGKRYDCRGCKRPLTGPIYKCLDCDKFCLHKKCVEDFPLKINHPYDPAHPLSLILRNPTAHQQDCSCTLCKIKWDGFVYCCSFCNIELTPEDVSAPPTIKVAGGEMLWNLLSCQISFVCNFCGTGGDRTPYICTTGDLILHRNCISMPRAIKIARHPHPISHVYSVQQNQFEELECRICHQNLNARYGCYCCIASDCNYIAHVNCATDKDIWDGTILLEEDIKRWKLGLENESKNMITHVISEVRVGEDVMATEIKHAFHPHNLVLTFMGEIEISEDDKICCDGCMLPVSSTPFYNCQQCRFFLHKSCAELPREMGVPAHKHLLKLTKVNRLFTCNACSEKRHGFSYNCDLDGCSMQMDVQCSLLPDTLMHPSHQHSLFLSHNFQGCCSGCGRKETIFPPLAYRCTKRCDFAIDFGCLILPFKAWYKYDKHPLTLTYTDNSDPNQVYCDFCEEERDSKPWFYYCSDCDNSLHKQCALGQLPLIKPGSTCPYPSHEHPITFVENIWNCPLCIVCGKVCYRQALECKESGCNFTVHWNCRYYVLRS